MKTDLKNDNDDDGGDDDDDGDDELFLAQLILATWGQQNPSCRGWKQMNYGPSELAAKI